MTASSCDIVVIGGGIAGLSAAAALARHASVILLEAEAHIGVHASGRSATMFHYALGNPQIRALTQASRSLFDDPPAAFESPPAKPVPILVHARAGELDALAKAEADMAPFTRLERLDALAMADICPILKVGGDDAVQGLADLTSLRIDQHALMQGYGRQLRGAGGRVLPGQRITKIARVGSAWEIASESGETYRAPLLVNAAGAWGDVIAQMAGVPPIGLRPLKRTIVTFDAPPATDTEHLPFAKTIGDELYFSGESGRLFASPMDEGASAPCDAQPDDIDVATAAFRMEQRSTVKIERIRSKWSGLRTFAPDRSLVLGFASGCEGFFWCVGQGGSGLQTSPAAAAIVESLIVGTPWPVPGVSPGALSPGRFSTAPA